MDSHETQISVTKLFLILDFVGVAFSTRYQILSS